MNTTIEIHKDLLQNKITVNHSYNEKLESLWNAFTRTEILEQWWAPKPYKAIVVENNFTKNGKLHYYMLSPTGEKHYCIAEFLEINDLESYTVTDAFCDEKGVINKDFPSMKWKNTFSYQNGITKITNSISFDNQEEMNNILNMGFESGFKTGLNQLFLFLAANK